MSEKGWICLHRKIMDHYLWDDKPFAKGQAWIDLIMLANHETKKRLYQGEIVEFKRGTVNLSMLVLAERWGWDRKKVRSFLKVLERDGMVATKATTHRTTITLVNYGLYQDIGTTDRTTTSPTITPTITPTAPQPLPQPLPITNNENNENHDNNVNNGNKEDKGKEGKEGVGRETTSEISKSDCAISPVEPTAKGNESSDEKHKSNVRELKEDDFETNASGGKYLKQEVFKEVIRKIRG